MSIIVGGTVCVLTESLAVSFVGGEEWKVSVVLFFATTVGEVRGRTSATDRGQES
ncbi:hypothetical protein HDV57DRAFT_486437 [Trichoderma longibrachiatum]